MHDVPRWRPESISEFINVDSTSSLYYGFDVDNYYVVNTSKNVYLLKVLNVTSSFLLVSFINPNKKETHKMWLGKTHTVKTYEKIDKSVIRDLILDDLLGEEDDFKKNSDGNSDTNLETPIRVIPEELLPF